VNSKTVFIAAGVIAAAAIALLFVSGPVMGNILPGTSQSGNGQTGGTVNSTSGSPQIKDIQIALKSVNTTRVDARNANVKVEFALHNPNNLPVLIETVHYTVKVDNHQMTLGDTGEPLEGFLASQASSTLIVAGGNVTVGDTETAVRNNITAAAWDSMVNGNATYNVDGYVANRATSSLQTSYQERNFSLTYH
jgi:LEA14-like dessication related protein